MDSSEPTVISAILLSDHAIREAGSNKLTLVGIFSVWNAPSFPFRAPSFVITPFISNLRSAGGERNLAVRIENVVSRHVVFSAGGKFTLGGNVTTNSVGDGPIPVPPGMVLPEAGRYRIYVLIDGEEIGTRDFEVMSVPQPTLGQGPQA